jgi:hypothetical protein
LNILSEFVESIMPVKIPKSVSQSMWTILKFFYMYLSS